MGLKDVNYCFWNGLTMRACCVALRTMSRYLQGSMTMGEKIMYTCMCNWVPMLYSGKKKCVGENNNKKRKEKKKKKKSDMWEYPQESASMSTRTFLFIYFLNLESQVASIPL